jgi:acetyl-CoA carboxylase carboxyltransferase component
LFGNGKAALAGLGLGAQSMIGGGFHASFFTVAWPTGGMGLEGYVRLGFRKEMEAIADPIERERYYKAKVAELYANGKAVSSPPFWRSMK